MDKRKDIDTASGETAKSEIAKMELPMVESPSISPAEPALKADPLIEPVAETIPAAEPITEASSAIAPPALQRFSMRPRHKRTALLAASVALAGAIGAIVGAAATGGFATTAPHADVAAIEERQAMQKSISQLGKEVTTLKASLEATNKSAHAQIAKITERVERNASAELVTGSISPPQTIAPLPTPRPAPRIAAVEAQPARLQLVEGWQAREARDGFVYVVNRGEAYQVVPGAPLPGLGPVESVKRQDGRWVVTTPKGIIVSMRDRRRLE
jgi:hypothetical protein